MEYTIPLLDLSVKPKGLESKFDSLFELSVLDSSKEYLGHPDSVLLKNGDILTVYPSQHGKGALRSVISSDGGVTYHRADDRQPASWAQSRETPTVYRLQFTDGKTADKLVLISGNPKWGDEPTTGGFNFSVSEDEGENWSEFQLMFPTLNGKKLLTIVAMASLTQLKENGKFCDKWMAFFHTPEFVNYKTILTFENGKPCWSEPVPYFSAYREAEVAANMCEVEVIRSEKGQGDELCLLARSNSKKMNSLVSFSRDEGETWSAPVEAPAALNGERHKADYLADGRLFITFRSIERDEKRNALYNTEDPDRPWFSEGWIAWVGTYDDIKKQREGQYRIKPAHTYLPGQTAPERCANADVGYCGNVVLDGFTVVTSTYGTFGLKNEDGGFKTYVASKRINLLLTDELVSRLKK